MAGRGVDESDAGTTKGAEVDAAAAAALTDEQLNAVQGGAPDSVPPSFVIREE